MFKSTIAQRKAAKMWRIRNPEKSKESKRISQSKHQRTYKNANLKFNFGITIEDYEEMLINQNDCCKICKRHKSQFKRSLHVDHNHKTGKIRGILCVKCNTGLSFIENTDFFHEALNYLKE